MKKRASDFFVLDWRLKIEEDTEEKCAWADTLEYRPPMDRARFILPDEVSPVPRVRTFFQENFMYKLACIIGILAEQGQRANISFIYDGHTEATVIPVMVEIEAEEFPIKGLAENFGISERVIDLDIKSVKVVVESGQTVQVSTSQFFENFREGIPCDWEIIQSGKNFGIFSREAPIRVGADVKAHINQVI